MVMPPNMPPNQMMTTAVAAPVGVPPQNMAGIGAPPQGMPPPNMSGIGTPPRMTGAPQQPMPGSIPMTGLAGSEQALDIGREDIMQAFAQGSRPLERFSGVGARANRQQAALSGALGPEAQRRAYAEFQSSPGQDYLVEQAEKALVRQAAATGGLGGGELLTDLQRNAVGLAAQDFQNAFSRLGSVADRGLTASGQLGSLGANRAGQLGGIGTTRAAGRTQAGRDIAAMVGDSRSALADLAAEQGAGLGDQITEGGGFLADLINKAGAADAETQQALARLLGGLGEAEARALANLYGAQADYRFRGDTAAGDQQRSGTEDALDIIGGIIGAFT